jgi:plasmid maintenance system killer protein
MRVAYTPTFLRMLRTLATDLREEVFQKVEQLKDAKNHQALRVHKLKGRLAGRYSFSVDYRIRIIFLIQKSQTAILLAIGDHDAYR